MKLEGLCVLYRGWPENTVVREALAPGLLDVLVDHMQERDLTHREGLLEEIHALQQRWPDDASILEVLSPFTHIAFH